MSHVAFQTNRLPSETTPLSRETMPKQYRAAEQLEITRNALARALEMCRRRYWSAEHVCAVPEPHDSRLCKVSSDFARHNSSGVYQCPECGQWFAPKS
jgi:hypothetical protein